MYLIQDMMSKGIVIKAWAVNEDESEYNAGYDFFGVTKFPNGKILHEFEVIVEGAGCYDYFEQVNISDTIMSPEEVIGKMFEL